MNGLDTSREIYMRQITALSCGLGAVEEKRLSRIIKHSNNVNTKQKAIDAIVGGNLGLVLKCANEIFAGYHANLTYMDLVAEGNFWLFYAARRFSYKKNCRFSTYAYPIIRWHILDAVNSDNLIHVPINLMDYKKRVREIQDRYGGKINREILMEELGVPPGVADNLKDAFGLHVTSLDSPLGEDGDTTLKDTLKDDLSSDPSAEVSGTVLREYLDKMGTKCLNDREKKLIDLIFFGNDSQITYDALSVHMGVTRERCRQIYERAIRKLRNKLVGVWDINHGEDRIDKEKMYKEVTGEEGFCRTHYKGGYRDSRECDPRFSKKLGKALEEKKKKIFHNMV